MKKFYVMAAALMGLSAVQMSAQQLPNSDFEGEWAPRAPWYFTDDRQYFGDKFLEDATKNDFLLPAGWWGSNVVTNTNPNFVWAKTTEFADGRNSETAVKVSNVNLAYGDIPALGYISLGTPWMTYKYIPFSAGIPFLGIPDTPEQRFPDSYDCGTIGGTEFTGRPDALEFWYKRPASTATDPGASVVAYLYKGSIEQNSVSGAVGSNPSGYMFSDPNKVMIDRDRAVLGLYKKDLRNSNGMWEAGTANINGTEVELPGLVQKDEFALIASINTRITEEAADWTKFTAEFDYEAGKKSVDPEKINVVIAAGKYFGKNDASDIAVGDEITVDDVNLVYYSRLRAANNGGVAIPEGVYEIELPVNPKDEWAEAGYDLITNVGGTFWLKGAAAEITSMTYDAPSKTMTVVVTNKGGVDVDGENTHTYKIVYKGETTFVYNGVTYTVTDYTNKTCKAIGGAGEIVIAETAINPADGVGYTTTALQFAYNKDITKVTVPGTIKSLGAAFVFCQNVQEIILQEGVEKVTTKAFAMNAFLKSITLPQSLKEIGGRAFMSNSQLTDLVIPDGVTVIADGAFGLSNSLVNLTIGNGITDFDFAKIGQAKKLEKLTLGNNVKTITDKTGVLTANNPALKEIVLNGTELVELEEGHFTQDHKDNMQITVADALVPQYIAHPVWGTFACFANHPEAIEGVAADSDVAPYTINGRTINVKAGALTGIYTVDGSCVFSGISNGEGIELPAKGFYIVNINGKGYKIVVRY